MKKPIQMLVALLYLASCKPVELKYMDNPGKNVVMHTDSTTIRAQVQQENLLVLLKMENTYYWFDKGSINKSQGAYAGKVLHGQFRIYSRETKRPLQSGRFNRGLKTGRWLNWNNSGMLRQSELYKDGHLNGPLLKYDSLGIPVDTLKFRNGRLLIKTNTSDSAGWFSRIKRFLKRSK
ncbi:MAG TPA: hypothetical protein VKB19_19785 [Pedobacter sp.]|nr:hypothetical protein [Pedobacter sp.]